jgi:EmrB/QacA subfamily drug resistance transporter
MHGGDTAAERAARYRLTLAVLAAGCGTYGLLQGLALPVLPTLEKELHTSQNSVTWVLTAYLLAAAVFTPIMGRVGDMYGKRRVLLVALASFAFGALLAALATTMTVMIIGRVIQGVGGGLLPLSFGIIRDDFPSERVTGSIGALSALIGAGGGIGVALSGPITDHLGYEWLFLLPMIIAVIATAAAYLVIPESRYRQPARIDWRAPVTLAGWLVALLLGVSKAPDWGWGSTRVLVLLTLAAVLIVVWVRVELVSPSPLIDMHMMRTRAVWTCNLLVLVLGFGLFAGITFIPAYLQTDPGEGYGFGSSATEASLLVLPQSIGVMLAGMLAGMLARRFAVKRVLVVAAFVCVIPWFLMIAVHDAKWQFAAATGLMGIGFGLVFALLPSVIISNVPPEQTGVATGMNANIRTIGGAVGTAVMSTIVASALAADGIPEESGYLVGFAVLGGVTIIAALSTFLIPDARRPPTAAEGTPAEYAELALTSAAPADA